LPATAWPSKFDLARTATGQAALLTAVNSARRCFLGGVEVAGSLEVPLRLHWRKCRSLGEAVLDLQGSVVERVTAGIPRLVIGDVSPVGLVSFAVRATWDGWSGGVVPLDGERLLERGDFTPSGVLAGALAVAEAFQYVRADNALAGRRETGLSLWQPAGGTSWLEAPWGPEVSRLPSSLWLIGLGHLGQAFLWTLGLLPYADPSPAAACPAGPRRSH
jgi:hypothetical protein